MSQSVQAIAPTLAIVNGTPTTTSNEVAKHFGKQHDEVLRRIRNLLEQLPDGYARNFAAIQTDVDLGMGRTRLDPAYRITRDGFTLLAMGFTGKRALQFKLAYIDAFNRMEAQLHSAGQLGAPLDMRTRLLTGQSKPPAAGYPARLERTIDETAWKLAREAYELVHQHLRERVAFRYVNGCGQVDLQGALAELKQTRLGHCLTREAQFWAEHATSAARMALISAQHSVAELDKELAALNTTAPWAHTPSEE